MLRYPADYPADAARIIAKNWNEKTIYSKKEETAEACWNLIGYGLKATLGEPDQPIRHIMMATHPEVDGSGTLINDQEVIDKINEFENTPHDKRPENALPLAPQVMARWAFQLANKILSGQLSST